MYLFGQKKENKFIEHKTEQPTVYFMQREVTK